jgi:hypothetical protein
MYVFRNGDLRFYEGEVNTRGFEVVSAVFVKFVIFRALRPIIRCKLSDVSEERVTSNFRVDQQGTNVEIGGKQFEFYSKSRKRLLKNILKCP